MDADTLRAAALEWFKGYLNQPSPALGADAVLAAFTAGAEWAQEHAG